MVEPENLMLEHLRAIRGEMSKMADFMHAMSVEMTAVRQCLARVVRFDSLELRNEPSS